jgi:hypothetical protein
MFDLASYWQTIPSAVALVLILTGLVGRYLPTWISGDPLAGLIKRPQFVSWVLAMAMAFVGMLFDLGLFADMTVAVTAAHGFGIGLAANGIFDVSVIEGALGRLSGKKVEG